MNHAKFSLQPLDNKSTRHPVRPLKRSPPKRLPLPLDVRRQRSTSGITVYSRYPPVHPSLLPKQTEQRKNLLRMHWTVRLSTCGFVRQFAAAAACHGHKLRSALSRPRSTEALLPQKTSPCGPPRRRAVFSAVARLVWYPYQYGASPEGTCQQPREGPESLPLRAPA